MSDCLIVGGGVVGLSLAWELARHGRNVQVIDAGEPGRQTSWAGAGILPPASFQSTDPLELLTALSNQLHSQWAEELLAETGVDNGFRRTGGVYLARNSASAAELDQLATASNRLERFFQPLELNELRRLIPALHVDAPVQCSYLVEQECQIRNPWHLDALRAACVGRGVDIIPFAAAQDFELRGNRVGGVNTSRGVFRAEQVVLATGTWTTEVAQKLGFRLAVKPIRGQIVLMHTPRPVIERIIYDGPHYLVPREDGRLLVGSTLEDAGFDAATTEPAMTELIDFAHGLIPQLSMATVEQSWAGLRPASIDGRPYLGTLPGWENVFVATGHYRSGLQLSPGTAVVMRQLMSGEQSAVELASFNPTRGQSGEFVLGTPFAPTTLPPSPAASISATR